MPLGQITYEAGVDPDTVCPRTDC